MHAFSIHANVNNKTVHKEPSTNCRCEEAETKATITLMASLVIKRPLMYVLNRLFYLLLPLCLLLSLCLYPAQPVSLLMPSLGNESSTHTSDIWMTLMLCRFLWHPIVKPARSVTTLSLSCSSSVLEVGGKKKLFQNKH